MMACRISIVCPRRFLNICSRIRKGATLAAIALFFNGVGAYAEAAPSIDGLELRMPLSKATRLQACKSRYLRGAGGRFWFSGNKAHCAPNGGPLVEVDDTVTLCGVEGEELLLPLGSLRIWDRLERVDSLLGAPFSIRSFAPADQSIGVEQVIFLGYPQSGAVVEIYRLPEVGLSIHSLILTVNPKESIDRRLLSLLMTGKGWISKELSVEDWPILRSEPAARAN